MGQMVFQQLLAAGSTTTNGTRSIPPLSLESTSIVRTAVSGMCFAMGYFSTPSKAVAENDPRCALDDLQWWYAPATSSSRKKIDAEFPIWYVEHQLLPSEDRDTLTHNIEHLAQRAPFRAYDNMARYLEPLILAQPALQHAFKAIPEAIKLELWCGEPAGVSSAPSGRPPLSSSDDSTLLAQLTLNDRHLRFFDVKSVDDAGGSSKDAPLIPARFFQTLEERQNKSAAQRPMFNTEFKSQVAMPTIRRLLAGNPMIKKLKENNLFTPSADHGQADEDGASFLMELYEYEMMEEACCGPSLLGHLLFDGAGISSRSAGDILGPDNQWMAYSRDGMKGVIFVDYVDLLFSEPFSNHQSVPHRNYPRPVLY